MNMQNFVGIGDEFSPKYQDYQFHKGMKYPVVGITKTNDTLNIFLRDKNNKTVLVPFDKFEYRFEPTAKTCTSREKRALRARLEFIWNNSDKFTIQDRGHLLDFEKITFYDISKATFIGDEKKIAHIQSYKMEKWDGKTYDRKDVLKVYQEEEFFTFFEKMLTQIDWQYNFHLPFIMFDVQSKMDSIYYQRNLPVGVRSPVYEYEDYKPITYRPNTELPFNEYLNFLSGLLSDLFIDINPDSKFKELVSDTMDLYCKLPGSFGPTALTKIFLGTGKTDNVITQPYKGKYKGYMKYDQLFALVDMIDSYLWDSETFVKNDKVKDVEYSARFATEGSKLIDTDKIKEFKKLL